MIQLFNKNKGVITAQDENEFSTMLATVAQMIKHIDTVKQYSDINADLNYSLTLSKDKFRDSAKLYQERELSQIHESLTHVAYRVEAFSKKKQKETFKDGPLSLLLLDDIRENSKQKKAKQEEK